MKTIERNFKKNPHTDRVLLTFHTAGAHNLDGEVVREVTATIEQAEDLLNTVPLEAPAHKPTPAQSDLIARLILEITALDPTTAAQAIEYTRGMGENDRWTPGREGTVSIWIGRLIAKANELKNAKPAAPVQVADGRYAVEHEGTLKFFKVKNGRKAGFVFLDVQASDDWHSIRNLAYIRTVLALIAVDAKAAMTRYGQEIGECGRCGRALTSEYRKLGIGPVCIDK